MSDDEERPDTFPFAPLATDLDRQIDDPAEVLQRNLRLQTLQVARGELRQMLAEADDAQRIDVVPLEPGIDSDNPRTGMHQIVGNRFQQRLRQLHLPRLRLVEQRHEIDVVLAGGLTDVLASRRDEQPHLLHAGGDGCEVVRAVGQHQNDVDFEILREFSRGLEQAGDARWEFDSLHPDLLKNCSEPQAVMDAHVAKRPAHRRPACDAEPQCRTCRRKINRRNECLRKRTKDIHRAGVSAVSRRHIETTERESTRPSIRQSEGLESYSPDARRSRWMLLRQSRQHAEFGDFGFGLGDQGVELGDFDRVVALFVFAESEQVGEVLRPPAVEVELVLVTDGAAQFDRGRGVEVEVDGRFEPIDVAARFEMTGQPAGRLAIAGFRHPQAVVRQRRLS